MDRETGRKKCGACALEGSSVFPNRTVNLDFSNSLLEVAVTDGAPSMQHPCRVTAELPSVAIPPGEGQTVRKISNLQ